MPKSVLPLLFLAVFAGALEAQSIELHANAGRTFVDIESWADDNIIESNRLAWGATAQILFGQPGAGSTQFSLEGGYQHFLTYDPSRSENPDVSENAFNGAAIARVWIGEGNSFFEGGLGVSILDRGTDPIVTGALGKFLGAPGANRIPIKLRATAIFDGDTVLFPFTASIGLHFGP